MPDSVVNPDLERYGHAQYETLRPRVLEMRERALAVRVLPTGLLSREDEQTASSPLSHQARWQLQLAADHLVALDRLIQAHGLPHYAGYVLIRAAVESSATSYWMLMPEVSNRRVLRALRMAWWNHREAADFASTVSPGDESWRQEREHHLEELRSKVKGLHQCSLDIKRVSHTDMITEVERKVHLTPPSPLVAWRLCSALAHGNSATASMSLQHRQLQPDDPAMHSSRSSWALISALVRTALDTFDAALELFDRRASQL